MSGVDDLVDSIESVCPQKIVIFCPRFSVGFLWKLIDELALYRRKDLDELTIYIASFNSNQDSNFSLNECNEIQDFYSNIKIHILKSDGSEHSTNLLPGLLYIKGSSEKAFSFEAEFSTPGFLPDKPLVSSSVAKVLQQFSDIAKNSSEINRSTCNELKISSVSSSEERFNSENKVPDFSLDFISSRTGQIHNAGAGLNWGQPTATRKRKDINAAYLAVPTSMQKSSNIPMANEAFLCRFEDNVEIEMIRTGANGKNLTSTYDNQIFGRYMRFRLGVPAGNLITQEVLSSTKLKKIKFYKLANKLYFCCLSA